MWESLIYISSFQVHLSAKEVLFWTAEMEFDGREAAFEAFDKIQWPEFVKYEINGRKLRKVYYPLLLVRPSGFPIWSSALFPGDLILSGPFCRRRCPSQIIVLLLWRTRTFAQWRRLSYPRQVGWLRSPCRTDLGYPESSEFRKVEVIGHNLIVVNDHLMSNNRGNFKQTMQLLIVSSTFHIMDSQNVCSQEKLQKVFPLLMSSLFSEFASNVG